MKTIYIDSYFELHFDTENQILIQKWNAGTSALWESEIKEKLHYYLIKLQEFKPTCLFVDFRNASYSVSPQLIYWLQSNIIKKSEEFEVKKTAILSSNDFITALLIEQIFSRKTKKINRKIFSSKTEAIHWLKDIN